MKNSPNLILGILILIVLACTCGPNNQRSKLNQNNSQNKASINVAKIRPIFNVNDLVGKSAKEIDKILGKPVEAWTMHSDPTRQMREYALGESLTMVFYRNQVESIHLILSEKQSTEAAFRLCGMSLDGREPDEIHNAGRVHSEIFRNLKINNKTATIVFLEDSIKVDFR